MEGPWVGSQNFYIDKTPNTSPQSLPAKIAQG